MNRLIIAGGGTGGHFFPGLAVAEAWLAMDPANELLFVGTDRGIEARMCPREGLPLRTIRVRRLKGGGLLGWIMGLLVLPRALLQAWRILKDYRADAVLGVGGYASGPVVLAAALSGRPTMVLEQNARPGFTNRLLSRFVQRVIIAMEAARPFFPARKTLLLGNPVRRSIRERIEAARDAAERGRSPDEPEHLLVVGGSQGARGINLVMPPLMESLAELGLRPRVRHQTGRLDAQSVREAYTARRLLDQVELYEFIDDMAEAYAWSDLVICRAGATTVSELAVAGRPAILVPFPYAADNHQEANARSLADAGAALVQRESEIRPEGLAATVEGLLTSPEKLRAMGEAALAEARPRAARQVVEVLCSMIRDPRSQQPQAEGR